MFDLCVCVCGGGGGGWLFALLVFVGGVFYFSLWENKQITLFLKEPNTNKIECNKSVSMHDCILISKHEKKK